LGQHHHQHGSLSILDQEKDQKHSTDMAPKREIQRQTKELQLVEIKPADYKPINIEDIMQNQTHLTTAKKDQLQAMLLDFQDLFKGQKDKDNGEPIKLELRPGSKPFYAKPFSIPKAYQQVKKDKIARLESIG
jgi:hypothetical protein